MKTADASQAQDMMARRLKVDSASGESITGNLHDPSMPAYVFRDKELSRSGQGVRRRRAAK
jgi:hypothetical protein